MVRNTFTKINLLGGLAGLVAVTILASNFAAPARAAESTTFTATVDEMLTVSLDKSATSTSGVTGNFLYNKIGLSVATNNTSGFSATMTTETATTALTNSAATSNNTIPAIASGTTYTTSNFADNVWGYAVVNSGANYTTGTYAGVAAKNASSPSLIINSGQSTSVVERDIYFGAKATSAKASGTYKNSVVISVVSGVNTTTKPDETKTVTPSTDSNSSDNTATYDSTTTQTAYTRTNNAAGTNSGLTTTQVTSGNTTTHTYADPRGVTETTNTVASINEGTPLATGLAVTAGVAATAGIIFFIIAKRKRDEEDEEEF